MASTHHTRATPTPIIITPGTGWALLAVAAAAIIVLAWAAPDATRILLGGVAIALFLSFPVSLLARVMPRRLAILVTLLGLIALGAIVLAFALPTLGDQLGAIIDALPRLGAASEGLLRRMLQALHERGLGPEPDKTIDLLRDKVSGRLEDSVDDLLGGLVGTVSTTVSTVLQLIGTIVVAGYLLADASRLKAIVLALTPVSYRPDVEELFAKIGQSLSQYLTGLVASAAIKGILAALVLWLLGVPNAFLLGVITALLSTIPLIGFWLAAIFAIAVALTQSPLTAVITAVAYLGIDQLDRRVVSPLVQSRALQVSPPITFLAVIAGGQIAGPLGAVLALPVVAIARVIVEFLVERLRVMSPNKEKAVAEPATDQGRGPLQRLAPLLNLTMSVVVLPQKSADVRSASRFALKVGDATLAAQRNEIQLIPGNEPEGVAMPLAH